MNSYVYMIKVLVFYNVNNSNVRDSTILNFSRKETWARLSILQFDVR